MAGRIFSGYNARLTGIFFIVAAVSSVIGLKLYDPVLTHPDALRSAMAHTPQVIWGAVAELLLCVTAAGTGILMAPLLMRYRPALGLGYLSFRLLEVVLILMGLVAVLTGLAISQESAAGRIPDAAQGAALLRACIRLHDWTFMLGPNFMLGINTMLYSYAFLRTGTVPRPLARLGLAASVLILTAAFLELFGCISQLSVWGILLAVPIALYEMSLAIWLLLRGYRDFPGEG